MDGILLIDKPAGLTTRQIDNHLKHVYSTKKLDTLEHLIHSQQD